MSKKNQFSKYANEYNSHNIIQQIVAKSLVRDLKNEPKRVLELGCGSGQIYKQIPWKIDFYKAIDSSSSMCDLHPKANNIQIKCMDFDTSDFQKEIKDDTYDVIISSSALQWSKNLNLILETTSKISKEFYGALFTSATFKTMQTITNKKSPILSEKVIKDSFLRYYDCEFETISYNLEFENKRDLFDYIKKSGVSGNDLLDFKTAKKLYKNYNLSYLEFEVIFIKAVSKI